MVHWSRPSGASERARQLHNLDEAYTNLMISIMQSLADDNHYDPTFFNPIDDELDELLMEMMDVANTSYLEERRKLLQKRYFCDRTRRIPRNGGQLDLLWWYKDNDPERFRGYVWVLPSTFDRLLSMIETSNIFETRDVNSPQIPVKVQLAIALRRFGTYGNSSMVTCIADWAGVAEGSVVNCTRRVAVALLDLHDRAFEAPTAEEIRCSKEWSRHVCDAWAGGYLSADGSTFPLFEKPGFFGEAYFDKSSEYSLNGQVSTWIQETVHVLTVFIVHKPPPQPPHCRLWARPHRECP